MRLRVDVCMCVVVVGVWGVDAVGLFEQVNSVLQSDEMDVGRPYSVSCGPTIR